MARPSLLGTHMGVAAAVAATGVVAFALLLVLVVVRRTHRLRASTQQRPRPPAAEGYGARAPTRTRVRARAPRERPRLRGLGPDADLASNPAPALVPMPVLRLAVLLLALVPLSVVRVRELVVVVGGKPRSDTLVPPQTCPHARMWIGHHNASLAGLFIAFRQRGFPVTVIIIVVVVGNGVRVVFPGAPEQRRHAAGDRVPVPLEANDGHGIGRLVRGHVDLALWQGQPEPLGRLGYVLEEPRVALKEGEARG